MYDKGCFHTFIWWGRAHRDPIHPRYGPTQFKDLGLLRQAKIELAQGKRVGEVCRNLGISEYQLTASS
jgi:hypothetical protein